MVDSEEEDILFLQIAVFMSLNVCMDIYGNK